MRTFHLIYLFIFFIFFSNCVYSKLKIIMERERQTKVYNYNIIPCPNGKKLFGRTSGSNFRGAEEDEIAYYFT